MASWTDLGSLLWKIWLAVLPVATSPVFSTQFQSAGTVPVILNMMRLVRQIMRLLQGGASRFILWFSVVMYIYPQVKLLFMYPSGEYSIMEQYYVYDNADFIADIGGNLVTLDMTKWNMKYINDFPEGAFPRSESPNILRLCFGRAQTGLQENI